MDKFPSRERASAVAAGLRVSAVVVVHKPGASLDLSLRSAMAEPWIDEVVIVDHDNSPQVSDTLRQLGFDRRDVRVVSTKSNGVAPNLSPAALANIGAQNARGFWLLFLDSGVVLKRGAVARLTAAGDEAHAPWIAGGRLTDTEGRERSAARGGALNAWSSLALAMNLPGPKPAKRRLKKSGGNSEAAKVAAVSAAFMLTPRRDFETLGGFDEKFATDAADLDLCRRAAESGGSVLYHRAASGVQFARRAGYGRQEAQGLARLAKRSAKTPLQRAFAAVAGPAFTVLLALRDFVVGRPPVSR